MKGLTYRLQYALFLLFINLGALISAFGQITPSQDSYTNTATATTNYGTAATLGVVSSTTSIQTTYIKFDLSSIPSSYTGANVEKATLKLYVNSVAKAGSFNVDFVNGSWAEKTITSSLAPALGNAIASSVPLTAANANDYFLIDVTTAVQDWLNGSEPNDGIALVANSGLSATFDSKENAAQSHPAELDIVYTSGNGTITGVTTGSGSGLMGGGTSGTLNLSLKPCSANQVLRWNGSAWACSSVGTGTVSSVGLSAPASDFTVSGSPVSGTGTLNFAWNVAPTPVNIANAIVKRDGFGSVFVDTLGAANVNAVDSTPGATTIFGEASSSTGDGWGIEGRTDSSAGSAYGVFGNSSSSTGSPIGVYGLAAASSSGIGVFGQNEAESTTGANLFTTLGLLSPIGVGVWGDAGSSLGNAGVVGTADNSAAGAFFNSGTGNYTFQIFATDANGWPFEAYNGSGKGCTIDSGGNINCTGSKNAVVSIDGGKRIVAMSAIEAPQNWFEDAGSAHLVSGAAVVTLDPDFIQTVNAEIDYKVFPVPNGDCKGLYVTNKTPTSFEVRELGGGASSVAFDYRIMALRRKYENVRFADHTNDAKPYKQMRERGATARPVSHDPVKKPGFSPAALTDATHPVAQKAVK